MAISTPTDVGSAFVNTSSTTAALATTGAVPSGAKIWVVVSFTRSPASATTVTGVADNGAGGSLTYRVDAQAMNSNFTGLAICSADAPSGLASGTTITVTFSQAVVGRGLGFMYSTGVQTGDVDYGAVGQSQTSNTTWSSTSTTVTSGDILIGGSHWEDSLATTNTASGGNSEVHDVGVAGAAMCSTYQIGTGASIAASGTWSNTSAAGVGCRSAAVAYPAAVVVATPPNVNFATVIA